MSLVALSTLIKRTSKDAIYAYALGIARALKLPVESWQPGDPTRSEYHILSLFLDSWEDTITGFISSGFLDDATGQWLKRRALEMYRVEVPDAVPATTDVVLTNNGDGLFEIDPGDLTFRNSTTDKTYRNTTGGVLQPGGELTLTVEAEEAGAASSAAVGEIDELVTVLIDVTCTNPEVAVGVDEQDPEITRQQCRDKLGALSPNGPKEAYSFVARERALTGSSAITRVRVYPDTDTGDVTVYLAGPAGGVLEVDRAKVELAILKWCNPITTTPTVLAASDVTVNVLATVWVYKSVSRSIAEIEEGIEAKLEQMFSSRSIGGDIIPPASSGFLFHSLVKSTIQETYPQIFRVQLSTPATDTPIANNQVAKLGTVTLTINVVNDP